MIQNPIKRFAATAVWRLTKPEYVFRPENIVRRFMTHRSDHCSYVEVPLYWGPSLSVRWDDGMSSGILRTGVDDIVQSEVIWRLLSEGDTSVDVGANIGYVSSIMAARVGHRGRIFAFEPHPKLCAELKRNASKWATVCPQFQVFQCGLSDSSKSGLLQVPVDFAINRGVSRVVDDLASDEQGGCFPVELRCLDDVFDGGSPIALMKIDVEGHELAVLKGTRRLLEGGLIQNIVFEDFAGVGSESQCFLARAGYTIWQLDGNLFGPRLSLPGVRTQAPWLPPNFLASLRPDRARDLLQPRGWQILRPSVRKS